MSGTELEEAKKAAKAMMSGVKPPGNCKGKNQCDTYCSDSSHMEECLNFAEKSRFYPQRRSGNGQENNAVNDERRNARRMQVKRTV